MAAVSGTGASDGHWPLGRTSGTGSPGKRSWDGPASALGDQEGAEMWLSGVQRSVYRLGFDYQQLSKVSFYKPKMEDVLSPPVDRMCQALLFALGKVGARRPLPSRVTVLGRSLIPVSLAGQKKLGIELTKLWGSLAAPGSHPGCSGLTEPPISCGTETTLLPKLLRDPVACLPGHGGSRQQSSPSFPDAEQGYSSAVQEVATCH
ncbi:homeobox protein goosecoid-2 isoform X4 [Mycteria americana]|uniref:homeobox protein goosecoid-2 isoform X4 n=1 Tax=Mycteria americana TaxID=33587 RepID=UPI003F586395